MKAILSAAATLLSMVTLGSSQPVGLWQPSTELWPEEALDPTLFPDYGFGWNVALNGDTAIIGSRHSGRWNPNGGVQSPGLGNARVIDLLTNEQTLLLADDSASGAYFGYTVALDGDVALVGCHRLETDNIAKAFIFERSGSVWSQTAMLDLDANSVGLPQVALDGDTALVSVEEGKGRVFVYTKSSGAWGLHSTLEASDGQDGDAFGYGLDVSGGYMVIGAYQEFDFFNQDKKGKAYIYERQSDSSWSHKTTLLPDGNAPQNLDFGASVSIDGNTAIIGSRYGAVSGYDVPIYVRGSSGVWSLQAHLIDNTNGGCFGCSVSVKGDLAVVGAWNGGNVFFYKRTALLGVTAWIPQASFHRSFQMWLGASVAMGIGGKALVSADGVADAAGSVYVFEETFPTVSPTTNPSNPIPTRSPTLCGSTATCSINPDPHYTTWDNLWYDYQGGCDHYAIDNPILQIQIRTRPRNYYSTITQVAIKIKDTGAGEEVFRLRLDGQEVENGITGSGLAQYSLSNDFGSPSHRIDLGGSYILVHQWSYGLSLQVVGCDIVFAESVGMCGDWDSGGLKFKNGTQFDLSGGYEDVKNRSPGLAESWKIDPQDNIMWDPSAVCDASSSCGTSEMFACEDDRRRLQVNSGCPFACSDISVPQFREQCLKDVELTGDPTWACGANYLTPVLATERTETPTKVPTIAPMVSPGVGFGKWYVDWNREHCQQDCVEGPSASASCGGSAQNWDTLFGDADSCCQTKLPYKHADWCEETSLGNSYPGTGKFYVDHASKICVRDCVSGGTLDGNNDCGEIIEDGYIRVYGTTLECCKAELGWKNADLCASESDPSSTGTLKFYVNQRDKKCVQDCPTTGGGPCGGPPKQSSAQLFADATECCKEKLSWLSLAKCLEATTGIPTAPGGAGGSGEWYIDWGLSKCVKDCVGAASCGGLKETWDIGHASANACCNNMISWVPRDECAL
mmetsp:Transcript_36069/g.64973  ORF Transcript_36069/g.64973 Transcript_36069/m.64973 type:complete len:964 (+) Transcript_36069:104-2995(+)